MKCTKCHKEINCVDRYCPYCGNKLEGVENPASANATITNINSTEAVDADYPSVQDDVYDFEKTLSFSNGPVEQNNKIENKPTKIKKKKLILIVISIVLTAAIIVSSVIFLPRLINLIFSNDENTARFSNGDYIFIPPSKNIDFDKSSGMIFYNNTLSAYLKKNIDSAKEKELAELCNGTVVGRIKGLSNVLQIKVDPTDIATLKKYAQKLAEDEDVIYSTYDFPMDVEQSIVNTESPEKGEIDSSEANEKQDNENEAAYDKDWWVKAVGADKAWNYSSRVSEFAKVGIIDNGFDADHEAFTGKDGDSKITLLKTETENTPMDHGTEVAGIIAANSSNKHIRGVSDKSELVCSNSMVAEDGTVTSTNNLFYIYAKQLVESGCKIINNSWNLEGVMSKEEYEKASENGSLASSYFGKDYEAYLKYKKIVAQQTADIATTFMLQISNSDKDALFVMSAGDGYSDSDINKAKGHEVNYAGFFSAIDEKQLEQYKKDYGANDLNYEDIKDRIIIVGAVDNKKDGKKYKLAEFSNYGEAIDLVAPGKDIYTSKAGKGSNAYGYASGSAMAAPIVSGSAAVIWSMKPELKSSEVKKLLLDNASEAVGTADSDTGSKYKMLNIGKAAAKLAYESDKPTLDKITEKLIEKYGVASTKTYERSFSSLTKIGWTNREGLLSASIIDLDNDGENELFAVRVTKCNGEHNSSKLELEIYEKTDKVAEPSGRMSLSNGSNHDLENLYINIFTYEIEDINYICYEYLNFILGSDYLEPYYLTIKYNDNKLSKSMELYPESDNNSGFNNKLVRKLFDNGKEDLTEFYFDEENGKYKSEQDAIKGAMKEFGFDNPSSELEFGYPSYCENKKSNKICSVKNSAPYYNGKINIKCSLVDYTGLDHSKSVTEPEKVVEWKEKYVNFLNSERYKELEPGVGSLGLIYLDDDDTPELILNSAFEAAPTYIIYLDSSNNVRDKALAPYNNYIERQGKLLSHKYYPTGGGGFCHATVHNLNNGTLDITFEGSCSSQMNIVEIMRTGDRSSLSDCDVNGKEVSGEDFFNQLTDAFDYNSSKSTYDHPDNMSASSKTDMISIIEGL